MRYWLLLAAKLMVLHAAWAGIWAAAVHWVPFAPPVAPLAALTDGAWSLEWTLLAGLIAITYCGVLAAYLLDQLYRCRTCCQQLRMPVSRGSWGSSFGSRPEIEYICVWGHGTLSVPAVHFAGLQRWRWRFHGDIWHELFGHSPVTASRG